eukprot:GILJ01021769.1.p1 GENE.GILJ01021769.1~~GILJ01021769.1.p1  ORF type:complete len:419 (+),score=34.41 GILJ01021769.1:419-1675(+)
MSFQPRKGPAMGQRAQFLPAVQPPSVPQVQATPHRERNGAATERRQIRRLQSTLQRQGFLRPRKEPPRPTQASHYVARPQHGDPKRDVAKRFHPKEGRGPPEVRLSIQFDFASWYDQIPLHAEISPYFSVDGRRCLASLPMGFRPSAEVAHCITQAIADFCLPSGVEVVTYIDNIRFGGPTKKAVISAAKTFVERVKKTGAVLNEFSFAPVGTEDFLGENYNLFKKTRCLTKKVLGKVDVALSVFEGPLTYRQTAAIYGLLFFCSDVLEIELCKFFKALRYFRRAMAQVTRWDDPAPAADKFALNNLRSWLEQVKQNDERPIWADRPTFFPDLTIFCDASGIGWGAVSISNCDVRHFSGRWSLDEHLQGVQHSTRAEPLAVRKAVLAAVSTSAKQVLIMSDHQGLVFAGNAGYGKSEA